MKNGTIISVILLLMMSTLVKSQQTKGGTNLLMMRGEKYPAGETILVASIDSLLKIDRTASTVSITLVGNIAEKKIHVSCETPVLVGTKKIKLDKDGDLPLNQKLTIEVFGKNPALDKDTYEIQDESDEAIVNIMRIDDVKLEVEGTFSVKYFDSATDTKKLSATCHFLIPLK